MDFRKFLLEAFYFFLIIGFHNVLNTEISVSSHSLLDYLGVQIELPVLLCHVKHAGYKEVTWRKDYIIVKNGSSDLSSHVLSLNSILDINSTSMDNPFKLQGYYWCETDVSTQEYVHEYLFQIKNIYTYVGKLLVRNDSLGGDDESSFTEDKSWKKKEYEEAMERVIFRTMPHISVFVKDIKVIEKVDLEVHFYLYVRERFHPRARSDNKLEEDEWNFLDIIDYFENETSAIKERALFLADGQLDSEINFEDIELKSTLGCYKKEDPVSSGTADKITWPYARIGEVVIPDIPCLTKNGLAVTRMCTGSFHKGATWGIPPGKCDRLANERTLELKDLYDNYGRWGDADKIEILSNLTGYPSALGVLDLHIIAKILNQFSETPKLNQEVIRGILSIIDNVMGTNKTELVEAKNIIRLTSRFLRIFDNILKQANDEEKEIKFSKRHLMVDTKFTKAIDDKDLVVGLAVNAPSIQDTLDDGSVEFLLSSHKLPKSDSAAHFSLPQELIRERVASGDIPCQVNMVFFKEWDLFQSPKGVLDKRNYKVLPTPVMYISLSGGPAWNLTDPVQLYFKDTAEEEIEKPVCVYYDSWLDDGAGAWSSEGCEYEGLKHGYYHCRCHHLSIFAVILSQSHSKTSLKHDFKLGTSVYVACGVSIIALALAVLLYVLSKNWRKTVDHSILFCLSLTFLVCIIIIFISEMHFKRKAGCIALAMIFHYTIFSTFGWLMVQAVIYRLRFAKKTDVSEIPHFMIKAAISVWGAPVIIVGIIWFTKDFPESIKDGCWLIVYEVTKVSVIPILILINITLCINLCATYALTCQYRKDFLVGDTTVYNDVAIKFRVAFTIFSFFVLSWLFGFLALHNRSTTLRILFSISITLTAYYVTLFFIFQEVSFWDLCTCCKREEEEQAPVVQYQTKSYKSDGETTVKEK